MTIAVPKPLKPEPKKAKGIDRRPRCLCGHQAGQHPERSGGSCMNLRGTVGECLCVAYAPSRRSAPVRKDVKPKRKIMPRCKHCSHPASKHGGVVDGPCSRCSACHGYAPSIGARQKRRTPQAAIRRIADGLWSAVIHARPGGCEIQQYHQHECKGGYQAMHGVPRTFSATRWLPIDGFKGCAGVHKFFTDRPEAWSALLLEAWGLETFRELWAKARSSEKPDMDATVAALRAELAKEKE